jgi:hypothetical protein
MSTSHIEPSGVAQGQTDLHVPVRQIGDNAHRAADPCTAAARPPGGGLFVDAGSYRKRAPLLHIMKRLLENSMSAFSLGKPA